MIKIQVTQKHINKGKQTDIYCCPVAHAICDHFQIENNNDGLVGVGLQNVTVYDSPDDEKGKDYVLSRSACRFVEKFDTCDKKAVKPFNFILKEI